MLQCNVRRIRDAC